MAKKRQANPAEEARSQGLSLVCNHPMFSPFWDYCSFEDNERSQCPDHLYASVTSKGAVHLHPKRRLAKEQWAWVIAHCLLHLGLDHHREHQDMDCWTMACDEAAARLLAAIKFGQQPEDYPPLLPGHDEEARYRELLQTGYQPNFPRDLVFVPGRVDPPFSQVLAHGIRLAVEDAVARAAGQPRKRQTSAVIRARDWFISSYPLLGAIAGAFEIIEDAQVCRSLGIHIAAVNESEGRIYLNPEVHLDGPEIRFVLAHEFLHAGLAHGGRCQDRHPYLWNLACDFLVNGWLIEMGVGQPPRLGVLHDPEFQGMSADQIYDRICCDAKKFCKCGTFRGYGVGDMLGPSRDRDWHDLDDVYRRCLCQGLELHQCGGRGLLPAGLVEAIRALEHPPIPWDVELARWFDQYFPPLERLRSYARPSRRQQATPDIPRPSRHLPAMPLDARTFGVVLDTSGSMDRQILGKALGAIAAYAQTRDVPAVRLICCDAHAYDLGYLPAETIATSIRLKGRGGTVLQPGLNLLHQAEDFPKKGPILIITDAQCDRLQVAPGRHHAYLIPAGALLPIIPRGPVFRVR